MCHTDTISLTSIQSDLELLLHSDVSVSLVPPLGPLLQGELQVPAPSSPPKDPAGDQRQEQPDPAEEHGHAGPADAARQCHDSWHAATANGERTHMYEHTTATGETPHILYRRSHTGRELPFPVGYHSPVSSHIAVASFFCFNLSSPSPCSR